MNYTYALIQFMHWPIFREHIKYLLLKDVSFELTRPVSLQMNLSLIYTIRNMFMYVVSLACIRYRPEKNYVADCPLNDQSKPVRVYCIFIVSFLLFFRK